ncbi:MAG: hypothetical protein QME59_05005 [Candidatus Hydrothermarchaeota archaeon]|nr:hypothetical protein [Candidatus Hydrothermarchaeota archaeon]
MTIVKELGFASLEEIALILNKFRSVQKKTLKSNLQELEEERALFRILPDENSLSCEGFISGPNSGAEEDFEIKKLIMNEFPTRDPSIVNWDLLSKRIFGELLEEAERLKENILKKYNTQKKLEMHYFDLSLKYHELYRFFYEKNSTESPTPVQEKLNECKLYLDKLEY